MIELDQMKLELQQYETPLEEVRDSLDLDYKKQRIEELSRESEAPDFWNDADTANKKMKQLKDLQTLVEDADQLSTSYEDMMMLIEMGNEEDDRSVIETIREDLDAFKEKLEDMRLSTLLTGEYDDSNAIVSLNAGAGGTESCDLWTATKRASSPWISRSTEQTLTDISSQREACTDLSESLPSTRRERDRPPLSPAMSCPTSRRILILSLILTISALIHTEAAAPADSISTRLPRRSVSRTSLPESS